MNVKKVIRRLDIFGKPVQLRLEKKKTHKTLCGGIMTLLIIFGVSLITIYYLEKLIDKQDPGVDMVSSINANQTIQTETYKLGFAINILNVHFNQQKSAQDSSINQMVLSDDSTTLINNGLIVKAYYQIRQQLSANQFSEENIEIPLVPCSQSDQYLKYWVEVFDLPENRVDQFICPEFTTLENSMFELQGDTTSKQAKQIQIKVNVDPALTSQTNWQDTINDSIVVMKVFDQMALLESYATPIQSISRTITEWIDLDEKKYIELRYNQEIITTDDGIYFSNKSDQNLQSISEIQHFSQKIRATNSLQVLNIFTSVTEVKTIYLRSYFKATVMLAYIGGFLQLTLILGNVLTKPFAKLSFYTQFVNEVFQFEDDKEKQDQQKSVLNETEQRPLQMQQQISMADDTVAIAASRLQNLSMFSPQRSNFIPPSQPKCSIDITTEMNQTQLDQINILPTLQQNKSIVLARGSAVLNKTVEEEQIKKPNQLMIESKKNSINLSPFVTELNTPIPIKKKSLYKNQTLLSNFREYFEADKIEKRLLIDFKSLVSDFFRKSWVILTTIFSKSKFQKFQNSAIEKLNFSKNKVNERLDIIYIVQKLQEIDKLKQIVLNKNQRRLFEYLPRPVLKNEIIFQDKTSNQKAQKSYSKSSEWSILKEDESIQQKAIKAWLAFIELSNKDMLDKNDKKVIKLLDVKAKNIFEITSQKISDQLQEQLQQINSAKLKMQANTNNPTSNIQFDTTNMNTKNNIMTSSQIGYRKSKNFYQFSIQSPTKRNSAIKVIKQPKLSLKEGASQDLRVPSLHFLDQTNKLSDPNISELAGQNINMIDYKESSSPTQYQQSSHTPSDSSFSSSDSSSNSDSSQMSESFYQQQSDQLQSQQSPEMTKLSYNNKLSQIKLTKVQADQNEFYQKPFNLKIELNEIPENLEKSQMYSQDHSVHKNSLNTPLHDFSNKITKKCEVLKIDLNRSYELSSPTLDLKKKIKKKNTLAQRGCKTEKNRDKVNAFMKYFDEVKNQDQQEVMEKKLNLSKFHTSNNKQKYNGINHSQNKNNCEEMNSKLKIINKDDMIEKDTPITPHYIIPEESQPQNQQKEIKDNGKIILAENKFLSRRKNQMLSNKKISTPQTGQQRKRINTEINDQYYSASFTQFLQKITPIIVQSNFADTGSKKKQTENNNTSHNNIHSNTIIKHPPN